MGAAEMAILTILAKVLAVLFAWFLVVLGWAVVNDQTEQREKRKSDEAKLENMRKQLDDLEELATLHHVSGYDDARAKQIAKKIKRVGLHCSHLEKCGVISGAWRFENIRVKRAVTIDNFERANYRARTSEDNLVLTVEESFQKFQIFLMRTLEEKTNEQEKLRTTLRRMFAKM